MALPSIDPSFYADFAGLTALKKDVGTHNAGAIRAAAQQFESLFTAMLLDSMRQAKLGEGLGESQQSDFYQQMYDQQLALQLSKGKGLGLADMLLQQLTRSGAVPAATMAATAPAATLTAATPAAAAPAAATPPAASPASHSEQIGFVRALAPFARRAAQKLGVSVEALIAQAALETGWGARTPGGGQGAATASHNLFGIKAGPAWPGAAVNAATTEYHGGQPQTVPQSFRAYDSLQAGIDDYVSLLEQAPHYRAALGTGPDVAAFAAALVHGGYATDPDYASKLVATAAAVRTLLAAPLKDGAGLPIASGGAAA